MGSDNLRAYYSADRVAPRGNGAVQMFLMGLAQSRFEMRYLGEERWHPAPTEDVAQTLVAHHPDPRECLDRLLEGEEVASRLARFRVAARPSPGHSSIVGRP